MKKTYEHIQVPESQLPRQPITIRLDASVLSYFRKLSEECGVPYQTLINLYLRDCAAKGRRLELSWNTPPGKDEP